MSEIVSCKPTITRKELEGVLDCLINDELVSGGVVKTFEGALAELTGIKYALAVNSLVSAYHLAFAALNIQHGDEVIVPSYFDSAPLAALTLIGGTPVLVDVDDSSLSPSVAQIREKVTDKTRAIVVGHLSGVTVPYEELYAGSIPVIEDISHAVGAEYKEKQLGSGAAIAVASFSPTDIITTGNGGVCLTANSRFFSAMKEIRKSSTSVSFDYTMTDFQGAMGISQLHRLQDFIERRREIARVYFDRLRITPHKAFYGYSDAFIYQSFPVIFDAPSDKVEKYFRKSGIEIYHLVALPLHSYLSIDPMQYPNSERLAKKLYSLPIYPTLSRKEIDKISRSLAKFI